MMTIDPRLHRIVGAQPYPLVFATISGSHLYGFPSPDPDFDLRGAHVLPLQFSAIGRCSDRDGPGRSHSGGTRLACPP
jgi:predicted nucleotidyltransferase